MSYTLAGSLVVGALTMTVAGMAAWVLVAYSRWLAYHRHKQDPRTSRYAELFADVSGELRAMSVLAYWHVRGAVGDALRSPSGSPTGPPVLCVHGITQNGSNMWGIRRALERRGRATRAVSLGPFGRSLERHVAPLIGALEELIASHGRVDIVAHSMGGVVLRLALATRPDLAAHVRRVVTLATPHAGTAFTRGLPLGATVRRLGRRSPPLGELTGLPPDAEVTTIAACRDFIVYPIQTCHLPGARGVELHGVGHAGLLTHRVAIDAVVEAICDGRPGAPVPGVVQRSVTEAPARLGG